MELAETTRSKRLFAADVNYSRKQQEIVDSLDEVPTQAWACGRRGGKSLCIATAGLHKLLLDPRVDDLVRPGEPAFAIVVATNQAQAAIVVDHASRLVRASSVLRDWLVSESGYELRFEHDGRVRVFRAFPVLCAWSAWVSGRVRGA